MAQSVTIELNVNKDTLSAVITDTDGKSTKLKIDDANLSIHESTDFDTGKPIRIHSAHLSQTTKLDNGFRRTTFWNYFTETPIGSTAVVKASVDKHIYLHYNDFSMASRPANEAQSLIMDKSAFSNKDLVTKWAQTHGFKFDDITETDKHFLLSQKSVSVFEPDSFRTAELSKDIKVQLGVLKDKSKGPQLQNTLGNFLGQIGARR